MATPQSITSLSDVIAFLQPLLTGEVDRDAQVAASIAVCERVVKERAELLKAVERLSRRLTRCTNELSRAARGLK